MADAWALRLQQPGFPLRLVPVTGLWTIGRTGTLCVSHVSTNMLREYPVRHSDQLARTVALRCAGLLKTVRSCPGPSQDPLYVKSSHRYLQSLMSA